MNSSIIKLANLERTHHRYALNLAVEFPIQIASLTPSLKLSPFSGLRTSPLWKMSTLVSKKSVSRKGGTTVSWVR